MCLANKGFWRESEKECKPFYYDDASPKKIKDFYLSASSRA